MKSRKNTIEFIEFPIKNIPFHSLGLCEDICSKLEALSVSNPTEIQCKVNFE